ncbi:uncharacterized protein [Dermacentor andersoni]|uniref:uncharacterized protein isoform X3 n=1 Tax=Dermacentor andersoni TaxID=34620 RepID=UPI003B3A7E6D
MAPLLPYFPIPAKMLEFQKRTISFNGLHILYTMGRRQTIPESNVKGFDGFCFRTFAITRTIEKRFIIGTTHKGAYARTELLHGDPRYFNKSYSAYSPSYSFHKKVHVKKDEYFSLALKCRNDSARQIWHRIEYLAKQQVQLSPGTFTLCIGVYIGNDPIRVAKSKNKENLGKPPGSQVTITIQVTITRIIFVADYGTAISIDDTSGGMPEFSSNFIMKRIVHELPF